MNKAIKHRQTKEKELLLEQLKKTPIVQFACEKSGVGRATYYRWRKEDIKFATLADQALDISVNLMNDLAESQLLSAIKDKNMTAIIFWLKNRHKDYSTKISLTGSFETSIKLDSDQRKLFKKAVSLVFAKGAK